MSSNPGDRFLLYTDGVIESESASGDSFGDCKLEQVVRPPSQLVDQLLFEIRHGRPESLRINLARESDVGRRDPALVRVPREA